jgi:hypothetical protein
MFVCCAVGSETVNLFQVSLVFEGLKMSFTSPRVREKVCCFDENKYVCILDFKLPPCSKCCMLSFG